MHTEAVKMRSDPVEGSPRNAQRRLPTPQDQRREDSQKGVLHPPTHAAVYVVEEFSAMADEEALSEDD